MKTISGSVLHAFFQANVTLLSLGIFLGQGDQGSQAFLLEKTGYICILQINQSSFNELKFT